MPTRITFATQPIITESKDLPMEIENSSTDVEVKNNIISPIKAPGPSTIITPEEDSGFENMEVDEPKESNFQESIRRKRPLELPVVIFIFRYVFIAHYNCIIFFLRIFPKKI